MRRPTLVKIGSGTFAAVIRSYQMSPTYDRLAASTRYSYAKVLRLAELHEGLGSVPIETIRPALVQAFLDGLAGTPGRQHNARTAIKAVESWALVRDHLPYPITTGTKVLPLAGGHEPWPFELVRIAEEFARPDLARVVTIAVHTGQRGSDIVKMRWSDIEEREGPFGDRLPGINVRQQKTGRVLWIPFTAELASAVATWERRPPFFLVLRPDGSPYTREMLSWHWNEERATNPRLRPLQLAGAVLHGLRATAVVRARKARATPLEIASMYGMSEPMVARYSRFADQHELAIAAVHHLDRTAGERRANAAQKQAQKSGS